LKSLIFDLPLENAMPKLLTATVLVIGILASSALQGQTIADRVESAVSRLKGTDSAEKFEAATDLSDLGPLAKSAVPALVDVLGASDDLAFQHEILITLGRIGTEAAQAVPAVAKFLDDKSPVLKHQAIHTLKEMGPKANVAVPKLRELLKADDAVIRISAAWGLVELSDAADDQKQAIPILLEGLKSDDPGVLSDAVSGLADVGEPAVGELVKRLGDSNVAVATNAADTLGLMGSEADAATGALIKALNHKSEQVVWHAAQALGEIGSDPKTVVPAMAAHLADRSPMVRVATALALGRYGNEADDAVPALAKALSDESVDVRVAAARALGAIGPDAKAAVPQLDKALDDPAGIVTLTAFEALGSIKGPAVRVLAKRLEDEAYLPLAAAVLGQMGPDAAPATIGLVKQLRTTKEPEVQVEILVALGAIGPKAEAAIEPLLDLAKSGQNELQRGAIYALAKSAPRKPFPFCNKASNKTTT
jgi:HEAT repeat protein